VTTGAADAGARYLEGQPIGVASAISIACFVGGACLWLEHRLTRIETRFNDLPCQSRNNARCHRRKVRRRRS
jgi:hypothetical protein